MSMNIDLMPAVCREALGRRAWMRRWATAYALGATVLLTTWWGVGVGWSAQELEQRALQDQVRLMYDRNEEIQKLLKEIDGLEASITRHNRLASPVRVSEAVRTMAALMPAGVSLNALAVSPREQKAPPVSVKERGKDGAQAKPEPSKFFLVIEVEGVSSSDEPVARFVAGLEGNKLFSKVGLDYTRSVEELMAGARGFRVTCEIDLSRSYQFSEQAAVAVDPVIEPAGEPTSEPISEPAAAVEATP